MKKSNREILEEKERNAKEQIIDSRREYIIACASSLFYEKGYSSSTLDEIASKMGVAKPYIYQYFKSKIEILSDICQRGTNEVHAAVQAEMASEGSASEVLRRVAYSFTLNALNNQEFVVIYFRENLHLPKQIADGIRRKRVEIDRHIKRLVERGVDSGEFRTENPRLTALAIAGMISYSFAWYRPRANVSVEELCSQMSNQVLKMVQSQPT